ncbi:hypothetical protein [Nocardia wallacei]|uniref:hypothetical protein n=1 Tax=Nocardia wallacei TaxID=480035 RepID=UPI00245579A6|nr:hypothetical protein [Nocardia wallacei]
MVGNDFGADPDEWVDGAGWPTSGYFVAVLDALRRAGLGVRDFQQMPPPAATWFVLDPAVVRGGPVEGPETAGGVGLEWSCDEPPGYLDPSEEDYSAHGWFYVLHGAGGVEVRGDLLVLTLADPDVVADALARVVRPGPWPALADCQDEGGKRVVEAMFSGRWYRPVEAVACGARVHVPASVTTDGLERRLLCDRVPHTDDEHRHVVAVAGRSITFGAPAETSA